MERSECTLCVGASKMTRGALSHPPSLVVGGGAVPMATATAHTIGPSDEEEEDHSEAWLQAMQDVTSCLYQQGGFPTMEELTFALQYVDVMESILRSKAYRFHRPPQAIPPSWDSIDRSTPPANNTKKKERESERTSRNGSFGAPAATAAAREKNSVRVVASDNNRFATFQDDDSDDDNGDPTLLLQYSYTNDDGGEHRDPDAMSANNNDDGSDNDEQQVQEPPPYTAGMDNRRLMIRVLNAQSEIYAARGNLHRKLSPPSWSLGAGQYALCLKKIHEALSVADSAICQWIAANVLNATTVLWLAKDASIVEVSVQGMTENRETFLAAARNEEAFLVRHLQPQWDSRDDVKNKWGEDKWTSNPSPKQNFARLRVNSERQLRDIRKAVELLEELDTAKAVESSQNIQTMLHTGSIVPSSSRPIEGAPVASSSATTERVISKKKRFNGQRPQDLTKRVDFNLYPDPTQFGWEFTGSWGVAEFFKKDGVLLDWYFTTATVKTSLSHPKQGKTQLFASKVDSETYRTVLQNPRARTGQRYHRK